ncbi:DNA topoisomerase 1 [Candidatus Protochlamydia amoebophila]|uniref:type I DNA topoisomerase n=1 Tax=Candidatus Protochlamydia amoebophila TaxID=362787 RepID=UPI001BC9ABA2|nr:type I DNA topoisomerase [Candidatus Protochlamydia amoebophila]MBS4163409.1 DNA topoisomerase 1 [Candidatus Protochlamydia amoebophila]
MGKALIIVESPAKIKTLKKFLGTNFIFESSIGHVRDLPEREFGIDIENDFEPKYTIMPNKEEVISKLLKAAKQCDVVYLSPDPDREGEAIAWHITQVLPPNTNIKRVSFNSITKDAVVKALENPREIDIALVNAQQARRLLDRIVGYKISPLLNRRIQRGRENFLSAGRVQSVALKLVVDREKEIEAFKPIEYWNIGAILKTEQEDRLFRAALYSVDGKRFEKEPIEGKEITIVNNKEAADAILTRMRPGPYQVKKVERKEKRRFPVPPFITSTLQQEASRHHGFSSARTMNIAQGLYEGVDLGSDGPEGLITYMRTDSVRISPEAVQEAREFIKKQYGSDFIPSDPKQYSTQKSAQDAHEAIRPASLQNTPEKVQPYLTKEQFSLYQLIWRRFLASQMVAAIYDTVSADILAGEGILLRATGSIIKFQGFLAVYEEKNDDDEKDDENRMLPKLEEGQTLFLQELTSEQAFTRPPPRFTEASLVKELEKSGIGRPSTYAAIMNKIQSRDYTVKENGRLKPTELGQIIAQMLETSFQKIMNIGFTAAMEDDLERVAENMKDWKTLIRDFWEQFNPTLEIALKEAFVPKVMTEIDCPKCKIGKLQKVWARSKYFFGCSRYPECDYSSPVEEITFNKEDYATDFDWEQPCPNCNSEMKIRHGRYGAFLGCTKYPECKGIINIPKKGEETLSQQDLPSCPAIECPGHMVARKSRFGKIFYSCSTFPECDVIVNNLEQVENKYPNHPRTPYEKKGKKAATKTAAKEKTKKTTKANASKATKKIKSPPDKPKKVRQMPVYQVSPELRGIIEVSEITRGDMTKKVWDYIKTHQLQDTKNKRLIIPDAKLSQIFGTTQPVDMFKMATLLSAHLKK